MNQRDFIVQYLHESRPLFEEISSFLFNHPETRFEEEKSAGFLAEKCEEMGFSVTRGIAGIPTAFVAEYGAGKPVIGFLGEYDALSGLSQVPFGLSPQSEGKAAGHGCGHNLLGTGSFAAACAAKTYLEATGQSGSVKFFGCPGEEGGSGKTFMVREGVFKGLDSAFCWHPSPSNSIMSLSSLANYQVYFRFKGTSSHAANSPHLGRSALDAVELMNVGVQYLREHIISDARIHYAITNTGGISPNVVQAEAEVLYLIRAPQVSQVEEIYQRVRSIAQGAAMMTGTELHEEFDKACSNYISNRPLERILYESLKEIGVQPPTAEEVSFAEGIWKTLNPGEQSNYLELMKGFGYAGTGEELKGKVLHDQISPYEETDAVLAGSTDVGDVSWNVPMAQLSVSTSALGTALHTWQMTSQGISSNAHKAMLRAAGSMALAAVKLFEDDQKLKEIQNAFRKFAKQNPYVCPIPSDVRPSTLDGPLQVSLSAVDGVLGGMV
ncbi:M20 family metallopeptidase [Bhargavaea ginsengi]|uniref:M20 family metallopeptidase n=1 Tax=Bhargavaea ginsengi TaxID=426757 RepID=UPI003C754302